MKKLSLLMLVDDRRYIRANCYQRQLAEVLENEYDVRMISMREMKYLPWVNPKKYDRVLSVLRQRTLAEQLPVIAKYLGETPLCIYDQDVWHAYMDDSPWKGCYPRILEKLNVQSFLLTTKWWSDFAAARGVPVKFVRMGMLPRYCAFGPLWEDLQYKVAFQGTIHSHRKAFYESLSKMDVTVDILKSAPYEQFLKNLDLMQIYIHTEDAPWVVDGTVVPRNALWIKDTEVAARGVFAIRDHEDESSAYGIDELPTIYTFRQVSDVPSILEEIQGMDAQIRNKRMREAAETMRRRHDWMTVVHAIEESAA